MGIVKSLVRYCTDPDYRFLFNIKRGLYANMPDEEYLKRRFHASRGYDMDFDNPQTFSEKLQWLKLHDHNPVYTTLVDKIEVKQYIKEAIGESYLIPTLGVWNSAEDIGFEKLPSQFVLKCTHDSGRVFICRDKATFNKEMAKDVLEKSLQHNFYWWTREWPYKAVKPRIIAEKLIYEKDRPSSDLVDYKFYCFNGIVEYCQVIKDRTTAETIDFFDRNWVHQDFCGLNPNACPSDKPISKPVCLEHMIEVAEKLSHNIPFVRIDLYEIDSCVKFGEITFYPMSGFGCFTPTEYDRILGDKIQLSAMND